MYKLKLTSIALLSLLSFNTYANRVIQPTFEYMPNEYVKQINSINGYKITVKNPNNFKNFNLFEYNGEYFLAGRKGEPYTIRVCGTSSSEMYMPNNEVFLSQKQLLLVSIDGLNVINGQPANFEQPGYVINRNTNYASCANIAGWRKNLNEVAQFNFTESEYSYNNRTGNNNNNIGVIGIAVFDELPSFYRKHYPDANHVYSESSKEDRASSGVPMPSAAPPTARLEQKMRSMESEAPELGTGHGDRVESRVNKVQFKKGHENPHTILKITYKTYDELVRMGLFTKVLRNQSQNHYSPNPFPGEMRFSPDPN